MNEPADDVSRSVHFSTDTWLIGKVPWALWVCFVGLVIALHAFDRGANGAGLALVYLAALGVLFVGWAAIEKIERSNISFVLVLALGMVGIVVVIIAVGAVVGLVGGKIGSGSRPWYSRLVNPPLHVFGWMLIYLGGLWITYALYRHIHPARPILALSPSGITYHRSWLKDLFIPWHDIQDVGVIDVKNGWGQSRPYSVFLVVRLAVFERQIAPRLGVLAPPGAKSMFTPHGEAMHVVLSTSELVVDLKVMQASIEARWKAFRDRRSSVPSVIGSVGPYVVYGRWSLDGSKRQVAYFVAPLVAIIAALAHAGWVGLR